MKEISCDNGEQISINLQKVQNVKKSPFINLFFLSFHITQHSQRQNLTCHYKEIKLVQLMNGHILKTLLINNTYAFRNL